MTLYTLAKLILMIEKDGLSKVRFAKTIYFVHKELTRLGYAQRSDLDFIRMPLGPVPSGFMTLTDDHQDIITEIKPSGLSYNSINYKLKKKLFFTGHHRNHPFNDVSSILGDLKRVSTSDLVEISHKEPSWMHHNNGDIYQITIADMNNSSPKMQKGKSSELENQQMQASLVKGMLDDIVNESTALEYPTDGNK